MSPDACCCSKPFAEGSVLEPMWTAVFNSSGLEVDLPVKDSDSPYSFVSCSQLLC